MHRRVETPAVGKIRSPRWGPDAHAHAAASAAPAARVRRIHTPRVVALRGTRAAPSSAANDAQFGEEFAQRIGRRRHSHAMSKRACETNDDAPTRAHTTAAGGASRARRIPPRGFIKGGSARPQPRNCVFGKKSGSLVRQIIAQIVHGTWLSTSAFILSSRALTPSTRAATDVGSCPRARRVNGLAAKSRQSRRTRVANKHQTE